MSRSRNIEWVRWAPELVIVQAFITIEPSARIIKHTAHQSLDSAICISKHDERWLLFNSQSLKTRVGALDMLAPAGGALDKPRNIPTAISLDVAVVYLISSYRKWRFE